MAERDPKEARLLQWIEYDVCTKRHGNKSGEIKESLMGSHPLPGSGVLGREEDNLCILNCIVGCLIYQKLGVRLRGAVGERKIRF